MLLRNYNRVVEIDETISNLHAELAKLYLERSEIVFTTETTGSSTGETVAETASTSRKTSVHDSWEQTTYEDLRAQWLAYQINLPAFSTLSKKLSQTKDVLDDLAVTTPEIEFTVMALPPAKQFNTMFEDKVFAIKKMRFNPAIDLKDTSKSRSWRIMVVALTPTVDQVESYEDLISLDHIAVGDQIMPGMNAKEYALFALLHGNQIPEDSWSILKDTVGDQLVTVARIDSSMQFELDNKDVLVGSNHFRPAMEIL